MKFLIFLCALFFISSVSAFDTVLGQLKFACLQKYCTTKVLKKCQDNKREFKKYQMCVEAEEKRLERIRKKHGPPDQK